ncbi:HEPN domain-containing protein [Larkinella rosea]|uniref:HEPN domain-containing protein n=1 Tax=Larkinella rosea TaxID=2025312 RepID=A0A3P1BCD5_9BACT|nr:HEPN domain-containing protein [Larkinella rosea]RRA98684.1 HEPN domain-containing protein [Larkinella rosea]
MKDAIRLRIKKAEENLAATKSNLEDEFFGVAVNRAYYAMFCATQALLLINGFHVKTHKGMHVKFGELYIQSNIFPKEMATLLTATEDLRIEADYDFDDAITHEEAAIGLQNATFFVDKIKEYLRSQDLLDD